MNVNKLEQNLGKYIRAFYILMILSHIILVMRSFESDLLNLTITSISFCNIFLFIALYRCSLMSDYIRAKKILTILLFTILVLYVPATIYEIVAYGSAVYIIINNAILHLLAFGIIMFRISVIKHFYDVANKGV